MTTFSNATLLITGGTGSFGHTVLKHFLTSDIGEIRVFSRDEKKQDDMRHDLQARYPEHAAKVKFYIGDVRDPHSVRDSMPGVDYIFHAAALKQVPSCEFFPMQAVKTNVEGTDNVLHAAIDAGVKRVVCLSTDKAAYPINAMGISKANELDIIVYVDPVRYYNMPYNDKHSVARLIGKINWHYRDQGKHMMLIVPGRVGTTSPELGVPTAFADISAFEIICETEETKAGYNPELSYGSHIFQDLVEAEIMYTAVFNNARTICFRPDRLQTSADVTGEFEESKDLQDIVHVYDVSGRDCKVYNDIANEHLVITC